MWRERESPAAERAENKNTYVTSPLAEAKKKGLHLFASLYGQRLSGWFWLGLSGVHVNLIIMKVALAKTKLANAFGQKTRPRRHNRKTVPTATGGGGEWP